MELKEGDSVMYTGGDMETYPAKVRGVNSAGNADLTVEGPGGDWDADDVPEGEEARTFQRVGGATEEEPKSEEEAKPEGEQGE